ncbi:MAG TPA: hypothetical protein VGO89_14400, partial [Streptomyces sp.]|nr:hypothetical protein [Streptomyces sp.]
MDREISVGELAEKVAVLEQDAEEAERLRQLAERIDTDITNRMDEIEGIGSALDDVHFRLDDQLAEHDYMAVEQSMDELRSLVDWESVLPLIDGVLLLTALR